MNSERQDNVRAETLTDLAAVVRAYDAIADEFIGKVDAGLAHSHRTYTAMKKVREASDRLRASGNISAA